MSENSSSAQHITRRDSVVEKDPDSTLNDVDDDCSLHLSDEEVQIEQSKNGRGMSFHYEQGFLEMSEAGIHSFA
jgi:hypothetical protein